MGLELRHLHILPSVEKDCRNMSNAQSRRILVQFCHENVDVVFEISRDGMTTVANGEDKEQRINCVHGHTTVKYLLLLQPSGPLKTCGFWPVERTLLSTSDITLGHLRDGKSSSVDSKNNISV